MVNLTLRAHCRQQAKLRAVEFVINQEQGLISQDSKLPTSESVLKPLVVQWISAWLRKRELTGVFCAFSFCPPPTSHRLGCFILGQCFTRGACGRHSGRTAMPPSCDLLGTTSPTRCFVSQYQRGLSVISGLHDEDSGYGNGSSNQADENDEDESPNGVQRAIGSTTPPMHLSHFEML